MADSRMMANMINAGVASNKHESTSSVLPLPLNLIALIIAFLDRPSDLARICRTCRVFHYIALPQLYSSVSLRSYDYIRYCQRDGRPQGCGMASPFSMGLNGLVSRNVSGYVKIFEVCGEWKEHELKEHASVGRVPDESMIMNTLVRVAVEKMAGLNSFSWALNTKMLPTIWQGLAQKNSLTKLTVKFPSNRHPRPITLVPPIPNLQYLHVFDIDPLCYMDDISLLLLGSKKLQHLKMHWSPRMRDAHEPSVHQAAYFGKCDAAHYALPLRSIAIQNLYTRHDHQTDCELLDPLKLEEVTFLNSTGGIGDDGAAVFMDAGWRKPDTAPPKQLRMLRIDKASRQQCEFLTNINSLERLYLIGPHTHSRHSCSNGVTPLPRSPPSSANSPSSIDNHSILTLKEDYLEAITKYHGHTLKHLLLLPQWRLTDDDIALIVRQCPNLEQLGFGVEFTNFKHLRLLVPFLSNLTVIRLLGNPDDTTFVDKMREMDGKGLHEDKIGEETVNREWSRLRYMELGADDMIFEIGEPALMERNDGGEWTACSNVGWAKGKSVWRRPVRKKRRELLEDFDIWKMDSLDL